MDLIEGILEYCRGCLKDGDTLFMRSEFGEARFCKRLGILLIKQKEYPVWRIEPGWTLEKFARIWELMITENSRGGTA